MSGIKVRDGFSVGDWVWIESVEGVASSVVSNYSGQPGCVTSISHNGMYPFLVKFDDGSEWGFAPHEIKLNEDYLSEEPLSSAQSVDIRISECEPELADWEVELLTAKAVHHPSHYADGWSNGAEVIDITEHLNFNRGNAVKYLARAGRKDEAKELEDLNKALWYVQREIDRLDKGETK